MNPIHLLWICPVCVGVGFLLGVHQGDTVQIGGSGNSITVDGKEVKRN